ncbi:MAG: hypothetical protein IJJ25_03085 [Lachnospiraceae bacterium]|nr:hypothetical protein [Lachnospiraceae bacterium]
MLLSLAACGTTNSGKQTASAYLDQEADGGVYYTCYEDEMGYLASLNDSAYVLITADKADIEAVAARFALSMAV